MRYQAIISDWNGTLFEYPTDEVQNRRLSYAAFNQDLRSLLKGRVWKIVSLARLLKAKPELERRVRQCKDGECSVRELYQLFNRRVLRGRPVAFVNHVIDEYAREHAGKVDGRVARPIREAHQNGKLTGILSVSYEYSIRRILEESGYADAFDAVVADGLEIDGDKVSGLSLEIYDRKAEVLIEEFFEKRGLREDSTLYLGDAEGDEPIAELLSPGNFIVPFLAPAGFKQELAAKYRAFVPENEEELRKYLKTR